MNYRELGVYVLGAGVTFSLALCSFMLLQCLLCCHRSLHSDYGTCYTALDLTINVLGLASVVLYLLDSTFLSETIKMMEEDNNKFFDFEDMESVKALLLYVVLLVVLSVVRELIVLLKFVPVLIAVVMRVNKKN
jgi:hypothetical protein